MAQGSMNTPLARQQQALLDALLDWPPHDATKKLAAYAIDMRGRGLKAYQSNAHALAQRALLAAYPVLAQMVGEESFADLARALWHAHPPRQGDVARWGQDLAAFISDDPQLREFAYLPDVARCEWLLHRAAFATDAQPDPTSLSLLVQGDVAALGMQLAPGTGWVESVWPLAALLGAHVHQQPSLEAAAAMLRDGVAQSVVVWRQGLQTAWREAMPGESAFLAALSRGGSVLDALGESGALDFGRWLAVAVDSGLLACVHPLKAP